MTRRREAAVARVLTPILPSRSGERGVHLLSLIASQWFLLGQPAGPVGYTEAAFVGGLAAAFVPAAAAAGLGAWQASRLCRAGIDQWTSRRPPQRVFAGALSRIIAIEWLVLVVGPVWRMLADGGGTPRPVAVLMVGASAAVVAGAAFVGCVLGSVLPAVIAPAVAVAVVYLWMVLPYGFEPLWLRHLAGDPSGCCLSSTELSPRGVVAPLLVGLGLVGAAMVAVDWRSRPWPRRSTAGAIMVAAVVSAGVVAAPLPADPVQPRSTGLRCGGAAGPGAGRICLWGEHEPRRSEVERVVSDVRRRFGAIGVTLPVRVTEEDIAAGAWPITVPDDRSPGQLRRSVATGLVPQDSRCDPGLQAGAALGTLDVLVPYVLLVAGARPRAEEFVEGALARAEAEAANPPVEQARWLTAQLTALADCRPLPIR
ncbi:MAG: hypothetical protein U0Q22_13355 [Acidimicrobiales bacterium]